MVPAISLHEFVRQAWDIIEPGTPFVDNWHIRLLCEEATRTVKHQQPDCVVNIPPGCMKSILFSVCLQPWLWTWWPEHRGLFISYGLSLSIRDSVKRRQIVESDWYRVNWPHVTLRGDQNQKTRFENDHGGWSFATSTTGQITGEHPDTIVIDDPHKVDEAFSESARQDVINAWSQTISSRGRSRQATRFVIMQRIHREDLSGFLLGPESAWRHVCLPMRFEPEREDTHELDPRSESDELLWPKLFTDSIVGSLEAALGVSQTDGQLQQRPPDNITGMEWPASYFEDDVVFCREADWPDAFEFGVIAIDPSKGKDARKGDYSGIGFMGLSRGKLWVDCTLERRPSEQIVSDGIDLAIEYSNYLHAFGIETNQFQELLVTLFQAEVERRKLFPLPIYEIDNRIKKTIRISRLGPYFHQHLIRVRDNAGGRLLVKQCRQFSLKEQPGVHDDGPDMLEMGVRIMRELVGEEFVTA
jgi:hypothetical protein